MFSKFDTNPQSDELTAADLYDAQGEWEAEQYELEAVSYTHLTLPTIYSV